MVVFHCARGFFKVFETMSTNITFRVFGVLLIIAVAQCVEIFKCCPSGKGVNSNNLCEENAVLDWQPVFFSEDEQKLLLPPNTIPKNMIFRENTFPTCNSSNKLHISNSFYPVIFDKSGTMVVTGYVNQDTLILQPKTYCVSATGAVACAEDEVLNKKKKLEKNIHKCCVIDSVYSEKSTSCVTQKVSKSNFLSEDTAIFSGFPPCPSKEEFSISGKLDEEYSLNTDGTLRTNTSQIVTNYCVEYILERPNEKASVFTCAPLLTGPDGDQSDIRFTLFSSGFFVSVFFLTLTLISTFMLPGSHHALHWKCQTHYIVCLMIGDFLLGMTQVLGDVLKQTIFCPLNATLVHFFFLAAFFWLNTMCFNIWWTFRDLRPSVDKGQETYRLALYRLYAWGIPLIIVGIGAVMDQMLTEQYPAILRPKFGEIRCWFYGDAELFVYFLGPVGFLLVINLLLFVATTRELTCGLWKREGVKSSTERTALSHICLKLVIVMGITWIVDVISWAIGGPIYLWYLTDLVNALQGVFIFIVVGCQPQVWNAVKRKWFVNDSSSRNGVSSNATPSVINDQPSSKQTAVETLC